MIKKNNEPFGIKGAILTAREVCEYLKIPLTTLYGLSKRGKIPATKVGKHWRYMVKDVQRFLEGDVRKEAAPEEKESTLDVDEDPSNRRVQQRINCEIPVYLQHALKRKGEAIYQGTIFNLSTGGILFVNTEELAEEMNSLEVGDPVKVFFKMPSQSERSLAIDGKVVHYAYEDKAAIGIKFRDMPTEDHELIQTFVG